MSFVERYQDGIASSLASGTNVFFWHPFYACSVFQRSQALNPSTQLKFLADKRNIYRGLSASILLLPWYPLMDSASTSLYKTIEKNIQRPLSERERFVASFAAGAFSAVAATPHAVAVIASQKSNNQRGALRSLLHVYKEAGVKGIYRGLVPTMVSSGLYYSCLLTSTPFIKKEVVTRIPGEGKTHEIACMLLAAALPATFFVTCTIPLDWIAVAKQNDPSGKVCKSARQALSMAYSKNGKGFWRIGLISNIFASIVDMAGYNFLKEFYLEKGHPFLEEGSIKNDG